MLPACSCCHYVLDWELVVAETMKRNSQQALQPKDRGLGR